MNLYRQGNTLAEIRFELGKSYESVVQKFKELKNSGRLKIVADNEHYRVELVEDRKCDSCPNKIKFIFRIYDKKRGISDEFVLTDAFAPDIVYNVVLRGKKLAILGRRGGKKLYVVCVADVEKKQLEDCFWAYKLVPSPSGRYFVYVKFYSRHSDSQSNIVVIYDLTKPASENRLNGYLDSVTQSGLPIYPYENVQPKSYDQAIVPEHAIISPFLWSEDEHKLLFFDIHGSQNYMVLVDLRGGIKSPVIRRRPVDPKILIRKELSSQAKDFYRDRIDRSHGFPFVIKSLAWRKTGDSVVVRPSNRINPWIVDELVMALP